MNAKAIAATLAALVVWILVGLRFAGLTREAPPPLPPPQPQAQAAPRAPFVPSRPLPYDDPFARSLEASPAEAPASEPADDFDSPFGSPFGDSFADEPQAPPLIVQGIVGRSALLALPDGSVRLARRGDALALDGYAPLTVRSVSAAQVVLEGSGDELVLPVSN